MGGFTEGACVRSSSVSKHDPVPGMGFGLDGLDGLEALGTLCCPCDIL